MIAYYSIGALSILLTFAAFFTTPRKEDRLGTDKRLITKHDWFLILTALALFAFLALQDASSNTDLSKSYYPSFQRQEYRNLDYYFTYFFSIKDPFYHICTLLLQRVGVGFYTWKTIISAFFVFSSYRLIQRYSKNPALSYLVIISLGLLNFSLSALRQTIAISVIFFTYEYLREKKLIKFVLVVVIAALFHRTVLIFLLAYPLYHLKPKKRNVAFLAAAGAVIIAFSRKLTDIYITFFGLEETYSDYLEDTVSLSYWGVIILGFVWAFCTFCLYRKSAHAYDKYICNMLLMAVIIRVISVLWVAEFFRVSMYFSAFDFLAIADACSCEEKTLTDKVKTVAVAIVLTAYYFISPQKNLLTYVFFGLGT